MAHTAHTNLPRHPVRIATTTFPALPRPAILLVMTEKLRAAGRRLELALELHEIGVELKRQQLRRRHSGLTKEKVESLLDTWLRERPGAADGDATGRPGSWPRETG